jgi:hypothetical protein
MTAGFATAPPHSETPAPPRGNMIVRPSYAQRLRNANTNEFFIMSNFLIQIFSKKDTHSPKTSFKKDQAFYCLTNVTLTTYTLV